MSRLALRSTRAMFTTEDEVRSRGKYRKVVIELKPMFAMVRLAGMRTAFPVAYDAIYHMGAKIAARNARAEKAAAKKAGRA
jgi:hypothetical protein